jgi:hypothetical protein
MKGVGPGVGLITALLSVGVVKLVLHYQKTKREKDKYKTLIPQINYNSDGSVACIERFGDYVGKL